MKKVITSLLFFYASGLAFGQTTDSSRIIFSGTADKKFEGDKLVLYNHSTTDHDSTYIRDGKFTISVQYKGPSCYYFYSELEMKNKGGYSPFGILVSHPGVVVIRADVENFPASLIENAPEQVLYAAFTTANSKDERKLMDQLSAKYGEDYINNPKPDTTELKYKQLVKEYDELSAALQTVEITRLQDFVKTNPSSFASVYLLDRYSRMIGSGKLDTLYTSLASTYKDSYSGKNIDADLKAAKMMAIGNMAPEFSQTDTAGKLVKLSDFRGKYLLLDFWASWCGPCRAENPNVLKAYKKYKDKGFTVLGVSLDQPGKKEAWLGAIHKDGLAWTQVSDLKFWSNDVAVLYNIQAIPANILIDPQGKIVARDLHGEALEKKLSETIK